MTASTIEVVVKEIKSESPHVKSFKLAKADGSLLPRFLEDLILQLI